MISYRPATAQDVQAIIGQPPARSMRAMVLEDGGELLGLAGLSINENCQVLFFRGNYERLGAAPLTAVRAAHFMLGIARKAGIPVYAMADEEKPRAEAFLEHLGFKRVEGRVYRWTA